MRNSKWIYQNKHNETVNLKNYSSINNEVLNILKNREITKEKDIFNFLNPLLDNIGDPFSFIDMEKSVLRILTAIKNNEVIWIYGDYDVDGITSTSLCYLALTAIGAKVRYYIPLRDEGYGLSIDALSFIKEQKGSIVITVDCGVTSIKEALHANNIGIDLIITDHHDIINNLLPKAFSVINPKHPDNTYSFKYLAGVGTVFMLLLAIYMKLNKKEEIFSYLDIVAIGTIADIVPLKNDNRIFVKYGLELLKKSKSKGLRALLKTLFFEDYDTHIFTPYDIGFILAPVFNAAGRLEDAKTSVELFICQDHMIYNELIPRLIENNQNRKIIQEKIQEKCFEEIENNNLENKSLILIANKEFHHGVIGIVASKILDRFYKPTIVLEIDKNEKIAKASCRSTEAFNMIEALTKFSHYLIKFGGHHGAAGFSIAVENLEQFYSDMDSYCKQILNEEDVLKPIKIEKQIPIYKIAFDLIDTLKFLEPYGFGNPAPLFSLINVQYRDIRIIGKEKKHLLMTVLDKGIEIKNCIWWNAADLLPDIIKSPFINIAFKLKLETYKGKFQYKLYIEDMKIYNNISDSLEKNFIAEEVSFPIKSVIYSKKKIEISTGKIKFSNESAIVYNNRENISFLDSQTSYLLQNYRSKINSNFMVKFDNIVENDENYNVFISIFKDYSFESFAIKNSQLFQDIKKYLIEENSYTDFQKIILGKIFKEKINCVTPYLMDIQSSLYTNNELEILILTLVIYFHYKKMKVLIVTDYFLSEKIQYFASSSKYYKENYDFYIFIDTKDFRNFNFQSNNRYLSINKS
ncbi:MAG: single-stranded-DNA-specific exonuclease RecJ [Fusobacteriaceae bacterium]